MWKGEKMHKFFKLLGLSMAGMGTCFVFNSADAAIAPGRANTQRMPTMSVNSINTTANLNRAAGDGSGNTVVACDDGGVQNSDYTIEGCMNDVLSCVNGGALPNGLNDLFNEDLRNSIFNGMGLCSAQVEKCVSDVRKDCDNLYNTSSDVWIDFNARRIQPEYYSFVLRKTGLTPNQAENTCELLDRNAYGASFTAVSSDGAITSEYDKKVGAYNSQSGGSLTKGNPQGVGVNSDSSSVDGERGHYARWDASSAQCLIRVAAYNKDEQIKNSWLFGTVGNDELAEVWKPAGNSFTCNKDLFGFSLTTKTKTTALVGVGGGTLVGAGVGALAGHGDRFFDCENTNALKELNTQYRANNQIVGMINKYLGANQLSATTNIDSEQCELIVKVYDAYLQGNIDLNKCESYVTTNKISANKTNFKCTVTDDGTFTACDFKNIIVSAESKKVANEINETDAIEALNKGRYIDVVYYVNNADGGYDARGCTYKNLTKELPSTGTSAICNAGLNGADCISGADFGKQIEELKNVFSKLDVITEGQESNMLASTAIGAGAGAVAGGLATAITAFVEKNNINCRVGDGLNKIGFGKSYSIDSLKDFYVKWNLKLPDAIVPTTNVTNCNSWKNACASLTDLNQCAVAQVNYRPTATSAAQLVNTACVVSGSACIENSVVTTSYGACDYE